MAQRGRHIKNAKHARNSEQQAGQAEVDYQEASWQSERAKVGRHAASKSSQQDRAEAGSHAAYRQSGQAEAGYQVASRQSNRAEAGYQTSPRPSQSDRAKVDNQAAYRQPDQAGAGYQAASRQPDRMRADYQASPRSSQSQRAETGYQAASRQSDRADVGYQATSRYSQSGQAASRQSDRAKADYQAAYRQSGQAGAGYQATSRLSQPSQADIGYQPASRSRQQGQAGAGYQAVSQSGQPGQAGQEGFGYPASSDFQRYSRAGYGNGGHATTAAMNEHRRSSKSKKAVIIIVSVIAALLVAVIAYFLWFTFTLDSELAPSSAVSAELDDQLAPVSLDKPFYMLILGSDSREGSGTSTQESESGDQERSDVMILARVDAKNKQVTLVSIPRDTPYTMDDGTVIKINEAYNIAGAPLSVKAVSSVTGREISHYAEVHLSEMEAIVDALGGVEVYVDRDLIVDDALTGEEVELHEGLQTLNGQQAQAFARDRHSYEDSPEGQDNRRQSNVRTLLQAIVEAALDRPVYELPGTILELGQHVTSDLRSTDLVALALAFGGGDITMYSCTGPSEGDIIEAYGGLWFCYPNPEGWAELMRQVDTGNEPGDIDYEATQIVP